MKMVLMFYFLGGMWALHAVMLIIAGEEAMPALSLMMMSIVMARTYELERKI